VLLKRNNVIGDEIHDARPITALPYSSLWKPLVTEMPSVLLALVPLRGEKAADRGVRPYCPGSLGAAFF
jgi:hypothetical protein